MINLLLVALALSTAQADAVSAPPTPEQAAAGPWQPAARIAAQHEAMKALAFMDGTWRGTANAEESPDPLVQTERAGLLLDGTIRLVEGRAYDAAGKTVFNAAALISYDPVKRSYAMRSHAMGFASDIPLTVRPDGFTWTLQMDPGGPNIRYTATIKDGEWHEVGERLAADGMPTAKTFEMRLKKLGEAEWPTAGAVPRR